MEITYQEGWGGKRMGRGKVQGIRSINCRYKIDRGRVNIVYRKCRSQRTYMYDPSPVQGTISQERK